MCPAFDDSSSTAADKPKLLGEGRANSLKFVHGLEQLGFGTQSPGKKHFKRYHYDDEECVDRENLKKKYKMFDM